MGWDWLGAMLRVRCTRCTRCSLLAVLSFAMQVKRMRNEKWVKSPRARLAGRAGDCAIPPGLVVFHASNLPSVLWDEKILGYIHSTVIKQKYNHVLLWIICTLYLGSRTQDKTPATGATPFGPRQHPRHVTHCPLLAPRGLFLFAPYPASSSSLASIHPVLSPLPPSS